jgi:uncharacterized protein DUF3168
VTVDVERLLSEWLRARPDMTALVDDRVVTELPNRATFPLLRLTLIGGTAVTSRPLYLDESYIQLDAYGGPKVMARQIMDTARDAIDLELVGAHALGVITGVTFAGLRYLPDDGYDPPKPRYVGTVFVYSHP